MKKSLLLTGVKIFAISVCLVAQDFEVAPIRMNFRSEPGETETRTFTIRNHGNRQETIVLTNRDYVVHRHGEREILPSATTRHSISNWVTFNPSFVELQPNEEATVQVTFQAPVEDYASKWGIMSFASTIERTAYSADKNVQTGVFISGRVDAYITYTPPTKQEPNIVISNLREVTSEDHAQRTFAVNIDNLGDNLTRCEIYLIASSLLTDEEKRFETVRVTAYPQSSRTIELELPDALQKGRYSLAAILDYGSKTYLKGTQITIDVD